MSISSCRANALIAKGLHTILAGKRRPPPWRDVSKGGDIGFSFTRTRDDPELARRDLGLAVEALIAKSEIELALAEATRRLTQDSAKPPMRTAAADRSQEELHDSWRLSPAMSKRHGKMAKTKPRNRNRQRDAPLIDLNDVAIKKLIARAKKKGVITYDELHEALPRTR